MSALASLAQYAATHTVDPALRAKFALHACEDDAALARLGKEIGANQ